MPLYDTANHQLLRQWLIKSLDPICDADPVILADYVLALLQNDGPESDLRNMFTKQLEEFLENETSAFVDTLLSALRSKAYIPYSAAASSPSPVNHPKPASDMGIPIPLDALVPSPSSPKDRGRKRPFDHDDRDRDREYTSPGGRPPPKGPRMHKQGPPSRYPPPSQPRNRGPPTMSGVPSQPRHSTENVNGRVREGQSQHGPMESGSGSGSRNEGGGGQETKPMCRDYHNKGYCARGALCNYSHGEDAVIPPAPMWMPPPEGVDGPGPGPQFHPMMGMGLLPMMNMMQQFAAVNGSMPADNHGHGAYDPNESHMDMSGMVGQVPFAPNGNGTMMPLPLPVGTDDMVVDDMGPAGETIAGFGQGVPPFTNGRGRGGKRRGGIGRNGIGRGGAGRDDKTLVIEKIPPEHLRLEAVNDYFKRFGTVTNVAVDIKGSKALVSFASHDEAHAAWKSEEAIFGSRFVKVYWHRPMEGHGAAGKKALEASATLVQNIAAPVALVTQDEPMPAATPPTVSKPHGPKPVQLTPEAAARAKALEKNIAEQKVLFSRLKSAKGDDRKEIMARIKVLSDSMDDPLLSPAAPAKAEPSNKMEQLDKELDLQQAVQDLTRRAKDPNEDHGVVRKELEVLMAKAAAEGIQMGDDPEPAPAPTYASHAPKNSYRPYRGRGRARGRASFRGYGRGGSSRSLKLDLRPKSLVVKGVPAGDDALLDHVREWHQASGQADTLTFDESGDVLVQFRTRAAAEQALTTAAQLKSQINGVRIGWPTQPSTSAAAAAAAQPQLEESNLGEERTTDARRTETEDKEETGWGQEDYY